MQVICSVATSADGYMDDTSPDRLILSTTEDWDEVYRLRALHDAIMVGAETLRRDNPSLKCCPTRISITASGNLSADLKFFRNEGRKILFTPRPIPHLEGLCEQVVLAELTPHTILTELERRGIRRLFVEGGARLLYLLLKADVVDELRVAVNPDVVVGEDKGYAPFRFTPKPHHTAHHATFGKMQVTHYRLHTDHSEEDVRLLSEAIDESRNCPLSKSCYRVGALIRTLDGSIFKGYTHETSPTHHAEQEALKKALEAGARLEGGTIYSSMEPCSERKSEPLSCSELILRHRFARVVFACYEPSCFVCCEGAMRLRRAGVEVRVYNELAHEVLAINSHLFS